jgi:hypothetical protein
MPIVDREYEFTNDGKLWYRGKLNGFYTTIGRCVYIREIQQSEDESKAIELLKSLGYKIDK